MARRLGFFSSRRDAGRWTGRGTGRGGRAGRAAGGRRHDGRHRHDDHRILAGTAGSAGWAENYAPDQDWPRFELASYTRTIDFETNSSKEERVTRQGDYAARGGGAPIVGERRETLNGQRRACLERGGSIATSLVPQVRRAAPAGDIPHPARVPQGRHGRRSDRRSRATNTAGG